MGVSGVAGARNAPAAERGVPVTVASFDFAESRLLAEIYAEALERAGVPVRRAFGLGIGIDGLGAGRISRSCRPCGIECPSAIR